MTNRKLAWQVMIEGEIKGMVGGGIRDRGLELEATNRKSLSPILEMSDQSRSVGKMHSRNRNINQSKGQSFCDITIHPSTYKKTPS